MTNFWMVRAGEGGYLIENFAKAGCVAVGFKNVGDFRTSKTPEQLRKRIIESNPALKPVALTLALGVALKFRDAIKKGDWVTSYGPAKREYLFGRIVGDYEYLPKLVPDYSHVRRVEWEGRASRDALSSSTRNSLGSLITLFAPGDEVLAELRAAIAGGGNPPAELVKPDEPEEEFAVIWKDTLGRAHEFIKDRLLLLSPEEMEELTAALLRGMGFRARVSDKGPDRGRDVMASPDGLGFQHPRILAEVKHRPKESMGAPMVRAFVGGLREGDRGLYVSTGGFTKEANYEAERASVPVTLVDLDELARLVVEYYESFDLAGRQLVPLGKVYWPIP